MARIYKVFFDTKDAVNVNHLVLFVEAKNAGAAAQAAKDIWKDNGFRQKQRNISAYWFRGTVDDIVIHTWCHDVHYGHDAINFPYCVSFNSRW